MSKHPTPLPAPLIYLITLLALTVFYALSAPAIVQAEWHWRAKQPTGTTVPPIWRNLAEAYYEPLGQLCEESRSVSM